MRTAENISWPRIIAEGLAIVASILLAFGIDAWWQDRQTRFEEQQILQGLQEEFVSVHKVLTDHMALHLQRLQALEKLLVLMGNGPSNEAGSIVEMALLDMLAPTTSDLGNGTLDALLNSGRVEILASRTLRARLAAWDGLISEVWDDQNDNAKMVYEVHIPYFVGESIAVGSTMRHWYDEWPVPAKSISDDPVAIKKLLADSRFRVLSEIRYGYKRHLTQEFEIAIDAAEAILLEIENSIEVGD